MDDPTPVGTYLGCKHTFRTEQRTQRDGTKKPVRIIEYTMSEFCRSCVDVYLKLAGLEGKPNALKRVKTPFLSEASRDQDPSLCQGSCPKCHARCCAPVRPKTVEGRAMAAPHCWQCAIADYMKDPEQYETERSAGTMQKAAPKILMKILYGARYARHDLLCAVQRLACRLTTWDRECDRGLHRLMCYVSHTIDHTMVGWIGDHPSKLTAHLFCDADFAGCPYTLKSTSGCHTDIEGPNSRFPWAAATVGQTSRAQSTLEPNLRR